MNKKIKITILAILVIAILLCFFSLKSCYSNKIVHVSIDDVAICFKDLVDNEGKYKSLFDQPFFSYLKECHESTGLKVTLYTYEMYKDYSITQFSDKYKSEFEENSDWLKVGFHAKNSNANLNNNDYTFLNSYAIVTDIIKQTMGNSAKTIRLHYFHATRQEVDSLKKLGISTLLSSDDNRISYSLPCHFNDSLIRNENLDINGIHYERTDIRVENTINPIYALWENRNDEILVLFTHEWALQSLWNRIKFKIYFWLFKLYNCRFIIN